MTSDDDELRKLAEELGMMILKGLGQRSRWALFTGLETGRREGCFGVMTIGFPAKCRDYLEIGFTVNAAEVTTRWDVTGPKDSHD